MTKETVVEFQPGQVISALQQHWPREFEITMLRLQMEMLRNESFKCSICDSGDEAIPRIDPSHPSLFDPSGP